MEWISVENRLPENNNEVLGGDGLLCFVVVYYSKGDWFLSDDMINSDSGGTAYLDGIVEYWMPIEPLKDKPREDEV